MYTHTAALHSARRLAAGLLALTLLAGLSPPPAFAEGGALPAASVSSAAAASGEAGESTAPAGPAGSAPESAVSLPVSGEAENTPPQGPGRTKLTPGRRGALC